MSPPKMPGPKLTATSWLTSAEVAGLLGFDTSSVINWSNKGKLKLFRTPGGHRRFIVADVIEFVRKQELPMPDALAALDSQGAQS